VDVEAEEAGAVFRFVLLEPLVDRADVRRLGGGRRFVMLGLWILNRGGVGTGHVEAKKPATLLRVVLLEAFVDRPNVHRLRRGRIGGGWSGQPDGTDR
jgi:hypothetical protein